MASDNRQFLIIGGGQAGAWVARTLRSEGFVGRILLIAEEPHWPYERPPLSKSVLLGAAAEDEGTLLSAKQAETLGVQAWLGQRVEKVDRQTRTVICSDGRSAAYDTLFLTTGSRPRKLPQAAELDPGRVHYLRTRADAERLKVALRAHQHLLVLGAGWIGLEVAASARRLGVRVTVLEAAARVCARSVPPLVSTYLQELHTRQGVDIRLTASVSQLSANSEHVALTLSDGSAFTCDHVLIGIGVEPNVELARGCGLMIDNGIVVNAAGRTSDFNVYAAGDVTSHFNRFAGKHIRQESWANAQAQGMIAAHAALGKAAAYDEVPWNWSDQFDINLQIAGFPDQATAVLTKGQPGSGSGCWLMLNAVGAVVGAIAINAPRELRRVRRALQTQHPLDLSEWVAEKDVAANQQKTYAG